MDGFCEGSRLISPLDRGINGQGVGQGVENEPTDDYSTVKGFIRVREQRASAICFGER